MRRAAKASHYCIIPSSKNDSRKNGVSPGRLLTSFALGLPVIAEGLDSYLPFRSFLLLLELKARKYWQKTQLFIRKDCEAQELVRENYSGCD